MKKRRGDESLTCDGKYCRRTVDLGQGQQFVERNGKVTRLCGRCAKRRYDGEERGQERGTAATGV